MKRGFTLIELLVVVAMLAVLLGAMTSSVNSARRRALISKATQDVREMTNAILAYENYAKGRTLATMASDSWKNADEGSIGFLLGKGDSESGSTIPILYNAHLRNGRVLDPWGNAYQFKIKEAGTIGGGKGERTQFETAVNLPNYYRLTDQERQ